jgi:hypothetical protein
MPAPTLSNITTRGGLITADFIDTLRQDTLRNQPSLEYRNFPTYAKPAPENQRVFDEQMQKTFKSLVERYDAISNFYENYDISEARQKWILPLLKALGFEPEFIKKDLTPGGDDRLVFRLSHQGWDSPNAMFIHTVIPKQDMEKRPIQDLKKSKTEERRKWSPHEEMQRFLNTTKTHNWGIVTNGIVLRILRKFHHTTTKAYVEFDIDNIMRERNFKDFRVLYRLAHVSRFLSQGPDTNIIEEFYKESVAAGVRVYQNLRPNVKTAIEILGNGFLNQNLLDFLTDNDDHCQAYYQEIHRIIYRIMFLLYAEQRAMLPTRKSLFIDEYSITKLRDIAERHREPDDHTDLWEGLKVTFQMLQKGCDPLRVFAYNGSLFDDASIPLLSKTTIRNDRLLDAIRFLTLIEEERLRKRINYLDIGVEEMGSIYESLLDYKPKIFSTEQEISLPDHREENRHVPARTFFLDPRGTDRRSTGSYYTAANLVDELLTHALKPVAEQKISGIATKEAKEAAVLSLKVCDPACGSGAFLIAAMNYLGKLLAQIRKDQPEPPDEDIREARREVLQHCIYGVDKNPMAVELAKVSLWIDAAVEDMPLNFLDHHIKCGDSLVGTTRELLNAGVPDEAFKRTGDDNSDIVNKYKKQNKLEHRQRTIDERGAEVDAKCTEAYERLANLMEQNVADVNQKKALYEKIISSPEWKAQKFAADAWCAAFFWKFTTGSPITPTQSTLRILRTDPKSEAVIKPTRDEIARLAERYRFFHWWLEFPDVFGRTEKGFDVILGNPPFMGGLKISGTFGDKYRHFLGYSFNPFKGKSDLCATFFRKSHELIKNNGSFGLVATNTISQGDTRESGLLEIINKNGTIIFAHKFIEWPGEASVEVNLITIFKGTWKNKRILDFKDVLMISSHLDENLNKEAQCLASNSGLAGVGSVILGTGFILSVQEIKELLNKDPKNAECLFEFLSGDDINKDVFHKPSRGIINFKDLSIEEAQGYPDLFEIVQKKVKPERDRVKRDAYRKYWWRYGESRYSFYKLIHSLPRVIARSRISENHMLVFVPPNYVYSEDVTIFAFDDFYHFVLLQSNIHEIWINKRASTLGIGIRYTTTDCFNNFSFPKSPAKEQINTAEKIGTEYYEHRHQIMLNRQIGLTSTYNLFNDSECNDADIQKLRDLHAAMDNAILACYGWQDVELKHNFYQNERGQTRFTIAQEARIELLNRLLELNLSIAEQEQRGVSEVDA